MVNGTGSGQGRARGGNCCRSGGFQFTVLEALLAVLKLASNRFTATQRLQGDKVDAHGSMVMTAASTAAGTRPPIATVTAAVALGQWRCLAG